MKTVTSTSTSRVPRQERSVRTHNALLDAAERLLRERPWEKISTVAIMNEAGLSNGAIYGRFKSKDDLLVALYTRHDERLQQRYRLNQDERKPKPGEPIREYLEREVDELVSHMKRNRWLLRAMGILSRQKPEVVTAEMRVDRKEIFEKIVRRFMPYKRAIDHPAGERQIELAVFFVSTLLREALLYPGPHFDSLEIDEKELKAAVVKMALGFLGTESDVVSEQ